MKHHRTTRDEDRASTAYELVARGLSCAGDAVWRTALARTGRASDAEDVFQNAFLRLMEHTAAFESDEHLKAWLLRVTINLCHDLARSSAVSKTVPYDPVKDNRTECSEVPEAFEEHPEIWQALQTLPPDQRSVIHLFYAEEYSTREIAHIIGCEEATVRTRLHRARNTLRKLLSTFENRKANQNDSDEKGGVACERTQRARL